MTANHDTKTDLCVVFDLDGTLVDTAPDLLAALNHTLEGLTEDFLTLDHVRRMVGQGSAALIGEGLAFLGLSHAPEEVDALQEKFLAHYFENVARTSKAFPGVADLLHRYDQEGCKMAVCTNKLEAPSVRLLSELGLAGHFQAIVGRDTLAWSKPDPRTLQETIARAGGDPARTVYVGDSITDVKTAKAAQIPCILVTFGYTREPVQTLGGDALIDHFDELDAAISGLNLG